jgi:hypothetical protein
MFKGEQIPCFLGLEDSLNSVALTTGAIGDPLQTFGVAGLKDPRQPTDGWEEAGAKWGLVVQAKERSVAKEERRAAPFLTLTGQLKGLTDHPEPLPRTMADLLTLLSGGKADLSVFLLWAWAAEVLSLHLKGVADPVGWGAAAS